MEIAGYVGPAAGASGSENVCGDDILRHRANFAINPSRDGALALRCGPVGCFEKVLQPLLPLLVEGSVGLSCLAARYALSESVVQGVADTVDLFVFAVLIIVLVLQFHVQLLFLDLEVLLRQLDVARFDLNAVFGLNPVGEVVGSGNP